MSAFSFMVHDMEPETILAKYWGYSSFRPGQKHVVESILSGRDTVAILPTGGGKSICFQVPALMMPGITLVISPLISLMQDQVFALKKHQIAATFINSLLSNVVKKQRIKKIQDGTYKLVYLSPEHLQTTAFKKMLTNTMLSLIVVDEAHCISTWGNDFRPNYTKIIEALPNKRPPIAALTATATHQIVSDIIQKLSLQDPAIFTAPAVRKNLSLQVIKTPSSITKLLFLSQILQIHSGSDGIIYASTRKKTEYVSRVIETFLPKLRTAFYHGGLPTELRKQIQTDFISGNLNCIVATNAFGMGVDKSNVRFVVHYDTPISVEDYSQEIGRAGRDQKPAWCYTFFSETDQENQLSFVTKQVSPHKKEQIFRNAQRLESILLSKSCKTKQLARYFLTKTHNCYTCSSCVPKSSLQKRLKRAIDPATYQQLRSLRSRTHTPLPRHTAKLLTCIKPTQRKNLQHIPGLGLAFESKISEIVNLIAKKNDKMLA